MTRRWLLTGVAMVIFLGGCGTDVKRDAINHVLTLMENTTSKVKKLRETVTAATEKMAADKELDLSEPDKLCDELKKFCKDQVQKYALQIQSMRFIVSDAEREDFKRAYEDPMDKKVLAMNSETLELDKAIKKLEADSTTLNFTKDSKREDAKKAIEELKKKFSEAQGEFESLNRKS